jgi:hypothetical protein
MDSISTETMEIGDAIMKLESLREIVLMKNGTRRGESLRAIDSEIDHLLGCLVALNSSREGQGSISVRLGAVASSAPAH